jgi:hypothetical protein
MYHGNIIPSRCERRQRRSLNARGPRWRYPGRSRSSGGARDLPREASKGDSLRIRSPEAERVTCLIRVGVRSEATASKSRFLTALSALFGMTIAVEGLGKLRHLSEPASRRYGFASSNSGSFRGSVRFVIPLCSWSSALLRGFGRPSLPQRRQDRVERSDRRWRRSSFAQVRLQVAAARLWRGAGIWLRQRMQKVVIRHS